MNLIVQHVWNSFGHREVRNKLQKIRKSRKLNLVFTYIHVYLFIYDKPYWTLDNKWLHKNHNNVINLKFQYSSTRVSTHKQISDLSVQIFSTIVNSKVKVKFTLEQATNANQRRSRGVALLFP
jgi:hypothetical protein